MKIQSSAISPDRYHLKSVLVGWILLKSRRIDLRMKEYTCIPLLAPLVLYHQKSGHHEFTYGEQCLPTSLEF